MRGAQLVVLLRRTCPFAVQKDEVVIDEMFRWERSAENGVIAERQSRKKGEILARAGTRVGPVSPPCQAEPYTHRSQTTAPSSFISSHTLSKFQSPSRFPHTSLGLPFGRAPDQELSSHILSRRCQLMDLSLLPYILAWTT